MANVTKPNTFTPNSTISSSQVNDNFDTIYSEFNGNISSANLADNAVTTAKIADDAVTAAKIANNTITADNLSTAVAQGYYDLGDTPDTVTYNGNRSYDLVFNSNDLTDTVSNGMRVKLARTVTPPTQCTDLEAGSSQYWSKTSPAGLSFTTTFTCSAWVKLESYAAGGVISRRNVDTEGWSFQVQADGTLQLTGLRIAANNKKIVSYQSIPLNKWVHIAACIDMTVGDTTAQKIWIDGVEVPRAYTLTGTATALVQGTTALVVGANTSAGVSPFDGKIAQASVHSACLSTAQIQAMASQTISSSSPSIVSGFTMNGAATDVTANANDLTASGGATYGTDSPFNATEYGIITANSFSTNTTLTVQVPEGYAIPTSGGVSSVFYSTQDVPYGFPRVKSKWRVYSINRTSMLRSTPTATTWYSLNFGLSVPTGDWDVGYRIVHGCYKAASVVMWQTITLSTASATESDDRLTTYLALEGASGTLANYVSSSISIDKSLTTLTQMYLNAYTGVGSMNAIGILGNSEENIIYADLAYV